MKYENVVSGTFLERLNRFVARVIVNEEEELVHVKNTGRCREILKKGSKVLLESASNENRKTKYSIIGAYKGDRLVNTDSQVTNKVIYEAVKNGEIRGIYNPILVKPEVKFGNSRFDIYFETSESKGFIEVKGVTLENDSIAMFPDAPTERGTKHIYEMIKAVKQEYQGVVIFLIQMKGIDFFTPNEKMDMKFAKAVALAKGNGVKFLAFDSYVKEDEIILGDEIRVVINDNYK